MAEHRLALAARLRLLEIYDFSRANFGAYQAEAYLSGLERTFALLADFPRIGASVDELRVGYRRYRFQSHYVFYTEEPGHVVIRLLIHVSQDLKPQLFD